MARFNEMATKAAKRVAHLMVTGRDYERKARNDAFDIASVTEFTEAEAYEAIIERAKKLA